MMTDAALRYHGLIDLDHERFQIEAGRTIEEHLLDFKPKLETRYTGLKAKVNVSGQLNYIRGFADHANIKTLGEVNADAMTRYIVHLSDCGKSARTIGGMIGACKHFTSWLRKHGKLRVDPLETIDKPDPDSDRRLSRRMLLPTEWQWLVKATLKAGERFEMTAQERCLVYRVAIQTGLRAGELRSLTRGSFYLDEKSPYIKAESGTTKNRQVAYQYIDTDLASELRELLKTKLPAATVFNLPTKEAAKMLQADLVDARGLWLSEANKTPDERAKREQSDFLKATNDAGDALDFHSLRHTCGAWLAIRGTQSKVIQSVMRHSTITLTLDTYGHLLEGSQSAAINHAADLTRIPDTLRATGTETKLALHVLPRGMRNLGLAMQAGAKSGGFEGASERPIKPHKTHEFAGVSGELGGEREAEDMGFEPTTGFPAPDFESGS
jgi:integrase